MVAATTTTLSSLLRRTAGGEGLARNFGILGYGPLAGGQRTRQAPPSGIHSILPVMFAGSPSAAASCSGNCRSVASFLPSRLSSSPPPSSWAAAHRRRSGVGVAAMVVVATDSNLGPSVRRIPVLPLACWASSLSTSAPVSAAAAAAAAIAKEAGGGGGGGSSPSSARPPAHTTPAAVAALRKAKALKQKRPNLLFKAGLPFILFSVLASWVVSNALDGKLKEMEASQGRVSKSVRQAKLEEEQAEIMERIGFIAKQDFDNTKRIKRPHEILEERRLEREKRNAWHRRAWRYITRQPEQPPA